MYLSDRKKKILQIVVDDYISSASPISSKQIYEQHLYSVSPATIRNELSALEDMEYLVQPYTSSGRVPTTKAYRLYVAELMQKDVLTNAEIEYIANYFDSQLLRIEDVVKSAAKLISEITNYTVLALGPKTDKQVITDIKIVKITEKNSLLVIVIDDTIVKDALLTNASDVDEVILDSATSILTRIFKGKEINQIIVDEENLQAEFEQFRYLFKAIVNVLKEYLKENENKLIVEGQSKILQYPEFNDMEKAKQFFKVFDSKKCLMSMLEGNNEIEVIINIGMDSQNEEIKKELPSDCSIVTARYRAGGKDLGSAGVIGPARMQYGKVISVLDSVGKVLNDIMDNSTVNALNANEEGDLGEEN